MKQFNKILRFELKNHFTNKIFVGVTVFLVVAIAIVMFFPMIMQTVHSEKVVCQMKRQRCLLLSIFQKMVFQ